MVRESDAERCAVRLSAQRAPTNARDNIWPDRSMRTGQCLQFIVLDLVFIVRELKVRIPAHHTSSSRSSPTQPQLVQTVHTPMPKEKKKRYRVIGLCPRRASEGLFAGLHPCSHAMQPRCSDRVWEPPAARAPVSAALSRVRPIVVIDFSKKKKGPVCVTVARIQRHATAPEFRMSRFSWPYCLLLRTSGGLPVGLL
jgi:hypothetical protein